MTTLSTRDRATWFAILAALTYAISTPLAKLMLDRTAPAMMAGLLYLGAGIGTGFFLLLQNKKNSKVQPFHLKPVELPYIAGMVVLDIAAPIFLMMGLKVSAAANAALLNNFEIVATAFIALIFFREVISRRLWAAVVLITIASVILSFENLSTFAFSRGSILILLAAACWGLENNCTRMLSTHNPLQIVVIKGIFSGIGSLSVALIQKEPFPTAVNAALILLLGFVAYGLSITFYIRAQRDLGAAKTSAWYALAPFIGTGFALLIFRGIPDLQFWIALAVMMLGTWFVINDSISIQHTHLHRHVHAHLHEHGGLIHNHPHWHEHIHSHVHHDNQGSRHDHDHTTALLESDHRHEHP